MGGLSVLCDWGWVTRLEAGQTLWLFPRYSVLSSSTAPGLISIKTSAPPHLIPLISMQSSPLILSITAQPAPLPGAVFNWLYFHAMNVIVSVASCRHESAHWAGPLAWNQAPHGERCRWKDHWNKPHSWLNCSGVNIVMIRISTFPHCL